MRFMEANMLKVGLIGVGGISGAHIPAWKNIKGAELVALCDVRPEQMDRYEDINKYTSFDEMLKNEDLDILDICLPTYLHAEYSIKAMEKGINVICEKPISLNQEDVKLVYDVAQKNNVKFMVAQVLRFWREYEIVKKIYETKEYGKLLSGSMSRLGTYPAWSWDGWMMDEKRSGFVPFDLHIHDLDYMVYTFGNPKKATSFRSKTPEQDYFNVVYEYDGFFITTEASWYASPYPFAAKFRFQFENAVVAWENGEMKIYEKSGNIFNPISQLAQNDTGNIGLPTSDAYANEIAYFLDCVIADKMPDKVKPDELEQVINILKTL